ncbi:MAG TPA: polyhydroxyalkanoate synthesis regulator DNA-binding domain-containing protein [Terracidiphilus sp.]|nr:polyhydroxyalkanoate synthesis regulator DNA-binding domain-containing protein [Terracidiphilus sp.]
MAQKTIVIKKYENRRLYDTTNSRYVNLEEVAQLLQQGSDVQVIDASSGEDITRLILTQIIVEDAKTPESAFPLDLLRQMVIASGRASQESALQYMKAMLDVYQNAYRAMPNPLNPFDFMQKSSPSGEEKHDSGKRTSKTRKSSEAPVAEPENVEELRNRVADLEKLVSKLAGASKTRRRN